MSVRENERCYQWQVWSRSMTWKAPLLWRITPTESECRQEKFIHGKHRCKHLGDFVTALWFKEGMFLTGIIRGNNWIT